MSPPKRWEVYSNIGQRIHNTRFIAFKVPLKPMLCKGLPESQRFTPQHLVDHVKTSGHELKLVIDLTNTAKYYHPQDIVRHGIKYKKFYTVGHAIPNSTVVRLFTDEVDDFLTKNHNSESLIGVHCTHGVNRTGYLICRYMIDKLNFTPEDAIDAFSKARGHNIERDNYIRNLKGSESETVEEHVSETTPEYNAQTDETKGNDQPSDERYNDNGHTNRHDRYGNEGNNGNGRYHNNYGNTGYSDHYGNTGYSDHYGNTGYSDHYGNTGYSDHYGNTGYSDHYGNTGYSDHYGNTGYSDHYGNTGYSDHYGNTGYSDHYGNTGYSDHYGSGRYSDHHGSGRYSDHHDSGRYSDHYGNADYYNDHYGNRNYFNNRFGNEGHYGQNQLEDHGYNHGQGGYRRGQSFHGHWSKNQCASYHPRSHYDAYGNPRRLQNECQREYSDNVQYPSNNGSANHGEEFGHRGNHRSLDFSGDVPHIVGRGSSKYNKHKYYWT